MGDICSGSAFCRICPSLVISNAFTFMTPPFLSWHEQKGKPRRPSCPCRKPGLEVSGRAECLSRCIQLWGSVEPVLASGICCSLRCPKARFHNLSCQLFRTFAHRLSQRRGG